MLIISVGPIFNGLNDRGIALQVHRELGGILHQQEIARWARNFNPCCIKRSICFVFPLFETCWDQFHLFCRTSWSYGWNICTIAAREHQGQRWKELGRESQALEREFSGPSWLGRNSNPRLFFPFFYSSLEWLHNLRVTFLLLFSRDWELKWTERSWKMGTTCTIMRWAVLRWKNLLPRLKEKLLPLPVDLLIWIVTGWGFGMG